MDDYDADDDYHADADAGEGTAAGADAIADAGQTPPPTFGMSLVFGLLGLLQNGMGALPGAIIVVMCVFMLDTYAGVPSAKLYFVVGYFLMVVIFYTASVLCFPRGVAKPSKKLDHGIACLQFMRPFANYTTASFYTFSVGYLFGYWVNINVAKQSPNLPMLLSYYLAVAFFGFVFSVFYVGGTSWESGLMSMGVGTIAGFIWSQLISDRVTTVEAPVSATASTGVPAGSLACNGTSSDDSICRAFRVE
jgi:hypothetical protein